MSSFHGHHGKTVIRMDILPPERRAQRSARVYRSRGEVVDAQFVAVRERHREEKPSRGHNDNRRSQRPSGGMASRCAGSLEERLRRIPADLFSALVAGIFVAVFTFAGGFSYLFRNAEAIGPGPALDITHVSMVPQDANGMRVLLINGIVENRAGAEVPMPSIQADLLAGEIILARTKINPEQGILRSGQSRGFSARVPYQGGKLPDLRLSVAERDAPSL